MGEVFTYKVVYRHHRGAPWQERFFDGYDSRKVAARARQVLGHVEIISITIVGRARFLTLGA